MAGYWKYEVERQCQTLIEQVAGKINRIKRALLNGEITSLEAGAIIDEIQTALKLIEDKPMPRKVYTITVKAFFEDESRFDLVKELVRRNGRTILTQLAMISDNPKRQPVVEVEMDGIFEGIAQLNLVEAKDIYDEQSD